VWLIIQCGRTIEADLQGIVHYVAKPQYEKGRGCNKVPAFDYVIEENVDF